MKETISDFVLKNTEGLLELPAYLDDFNRMREGQEATNQAFKEYCAEIKKDIKDTSERI